MDYNETLDYLYNRLPVFSKQGASAYKKDLHNIIALEALNGDNYRKVKTIHVAGTNGKGSTSHMLAAVLQEAGYKTGLYTSPHLKDFRERIRINGVMIPEDFVVRFTAAMESAINTIEPSFFELTVSMAFAWFVQEGIDVAVIETGLGGRLDSTNIIRPELSIITNIGMDHMNILGDDLISIAKEKAGIIKESIPVVIGEWDTITRPVFEEKARSVNAPLYLASTEQVLVAWEKEDSYLKLILRDRDRADGHEYLLDLPGSYQRKNAQTVLQAIRILQQSGWKIEETAIHSGLAHTKKLTGLHGRWEKISDFPRIILDVGHNVDGIGAIVQQIELETFHHLHIIIGMVKDKEILPVLSLLPTTASYYFTRASIPRALPENDLRDLANSHGLEGKSYPSVNTALAAAKAAASAKDLIVVCGSVFVVGELLI